MHNKDSLIARLLKAQYYRDTNFLEAPLDHNPSLTWHSILEGREVIAAGALWQVRDGTRINIRSDKWLADYGEGKIQDVEVMPEDLQLVFQLLLQNTARWNSEIIEQNFSNKDATAIMNLPLSQNMHADWHQTTKVCTRLRMHTSFFGAG